VNAMEVLLASRGTLADPEQEYEFQNWNVCTCGHIYSAASGVVPGQLAESVVMNTMRDKTLGPVIDTFGAAHAILRGVPLDLIFQAMEGYDEHTSTWALGSWDALDWVSNLTCALYDQGDFGDYRDAGEHLVELGIARLEYEQRVAMEALATTPHDRELVA
jgi:hypothetical protein